MTKAITIIFKKNILLIKFIYLICIFLDCFFNYSYAQKNDIEQKFWILDRYTQNSHIIEKDNYNDDFLNNLRIKLINNTFYINDNKYLITKGKVNNISQLELGNLLSISDIEPFIAPNGEVNYLQFDSSIDDNLAKLLLPKRRLIYIKDRLLFINEGFVMSFLKPSDKYSFEKINKSFPSINLPINSKCSCDFVKNDNYKNYPQNLSRSFINYLRLSNNDNLYTQLNNYIININGIKLPKIYNIINPFLIDATQENKEKIIYLHLFSDKFELLDKIILESQSGSTRHDPATGDLSLGFVYYNIDKNYKIERRQRFEDETIEVQHHQVTKEGKFQELAVTSNCYSKFAIKDKKLHSTKSLLLTSHQANNYLRFDGGDLYDLDDVTMTLKPNEKQFCINYQQSYPITFGKIDAKQFFGDDAFYQQQVENFKKYDIDISKDLDYITFNNIKNTPLAKFLWNGNQAIYMKNTLFIVGKDYFASYRQPTPEEVTYTEYK